MMALQISVPSTARLVRSDAACGPSHQAILGPNRVARNRTAEIPRWGVMGRRRAAGIVVRSSLEMAGPTVGQVTEVNKDTFWPLVRGAGDKVVVLDMYTQWCGPCKVIAPKFQELSKKYLDVVFMKLDCNQENKSLAKELGLRVVPTFKILKDNKVVKEVTGAKLDDLVLAIETVKAGQ